VRQSQQLHNLEQVILDEKVNEYRNIGARIQLPDTGPAIERGGGLGWTKRSGRGGAKNKPAHKHDSKGKTEGGRERVLVVYVKGGSADN